MRGAELRKPDEPDWLDAPPLELPALVANGVDRLAGCTSVSAIEWRLAAVLLEHEDAFRILLARTRYRLEVKDDEYNTLPRSRAHRLRDLEHPFDEWVQGYARLLPTSVRTLIWYVKLEGVVRAAAALEAERAEAEARTTLVEIVRLVRLLESRRNGLPVLAEQRPTLLLDEVDAIFGTSKAREQHEDLRAILNAGYRRGTPVLRCVGEGSKQHVVRFDVFSAKALSGIGRLPDTLADRCLPIRMKRRAPSEPVERFNRRTTPDEAEPVRQMIERWVEYAVDDLAVAAPALPDELDDRAQDSYEPLLAIADLVGGTWPERARVALVELRRGAQDDDADAIGVQLLADVRKVFDADGIDRISSKQLVARLREDTEAPWADWRGQRSHGARPRHHSAGLRGPLPDGPAP